MCTLKRFDAYSVNYIGNALECFGVVLFYGGECWKVVWINMFYIRSGMGYNIFVNFFVN